MGSRRLFSRRSVLGLVVGMVLGFNLASWIALPVSNHTDIEIELIAGGGGMDYQQLRLGVARVRRNNKVGLVKSGKDCDHEVIDYGNGFKKREGYRGKRQGSNSKPIDQDRDETPMEDPEDEDFDEFDLEAERRKRQKELEVFYESDVESEDDSEIGDDTEMLEDFQYPVNVKKYVDYEPELTSPIAKRKHGQRKAKGNLQDRHKLPDHQPDDNPESKAKISHDRKHFIYIGVLTAQKYLLTRGRAIMDTWAKLVPGKVEFYVGEGVENIQDGGPHLPLVKLKGVQDDAYPPQKKSFLLLKTMYDAYLNSGYQWFMRADDDAYVKTEKLEKFLRSLNSSQPIFLGQTGLGNAEERGRLSLPHGDNYCMGGPGMIFSREVVRRVGPHLRNCVRHLYSWHEDVELSRCIRRFAEVNCAWSYQMQELFYEHYTLRKGYIDPYQDPNNLKLYSAMTLHPNKNPQYQVKLHKFMRSLRLQSLATRIKMLSRDVVNMDNRLDLPIRMEDFMLGAPPSLNRFLPQNASGVRSWDFLTDRLWYSPPPLQARKSATADKHSAVKHLVMRIMQSMNSNSKARGRLIEFKQVAYGYHRVNPLYGAEYVLDLLLLYKRFRGKSISIPVRRHAYLQQTFSRTVMHENTPLDVASIYATVQNLKPGVVRSLLNSLQKKSQGAMEAIGFQFSKSNQSVLDNSQKDSESNRFKTGKVLRFDSGKFASFSNEVDIADVRTVNIIIPLKGRFETFRTFLSNLEKVCLLENDPVSLLIILFTSNDSFGKEEDKKTIEHLSTYAKRYPKFELRLIPINGNFSRGLGLQIGASHFSSDSLLFFCDVDVVFDNSFTRKCRANTVNGSSVYYPILFSEFHPNFDRVWSLQDHLSNPTLNLHKLLNSSEIRQSQQMQNHFEVRDSLGYWRNYGFGLLCTHKSDFLESGGFDISIQGWGMEDVDLVNKFISGHSSANKEDVNQDKKSVLHHKVKVFRAFDPSLVHVYHTSSCDVNLAENQLRMCRASRASGLSSVVSLANAWTQLESHQNSSRPVKLLDPVSEILPADPDLEVNNHKQINKNLGYPRNKDKNLKRKRISLKSDRTYNKRQKFK